MVLSAIIKFVDAEVLSSFALFNPTFFCFIKAKHLPLSLYLMQRKHLFYLETLCQVAQLLEWSL